MNEMTVAQGWQMIFLIAGVAGMVAAVLVPLMLRTKIMPLGNKIAATLGATIVVFTVSFIVVFTALSNFTVPGESLVLSPEGKIVATFPEERVFWPYTWRWAELNRQGKIISYASRRKEVTRVFQPISENPKVRNIRYTVSIFVMGSPESYLEYQRFKAVLGDEKADEFLQYWLYEFQEQYGRQLAELYNPLSREQQKKFESLIINFLEPLLKNKGMRLGSAEFTIEG